jgi:RND family efflux transporter MFP subunit
MGASALLAVRWASSLALVILITCFTVCARPPAGPPPMPPSAVTVAKPVQERIVDHADFTGQLAAVDNVDMRPRVSGYIDRIVFKEGDLVKVGELLEVIDPRPYQAASDQATANLRQAEAQQKLSEANFARAQDLRAKNVIATQDYDTAVAQKNQADAQVLAAQAAVNAAQLNLGFTQIKAPIAGRISRQLVTVGNLVQADQTTLTNIVSVDPIYAYADVDENTVLRYEQLIAKGSAPDARQTKVPISIAPGDQKDFNHQGVIDFVDNKIDPATGTLQIRGVFSNRDGMLLPGMFVRVRVPTSEPYDALLIADQAVISDQGLKFVFVVTADKKANQVRVTLGPLVDNLRVVREGLKPDDEVIVDGIVKARPGAPVRPEPGDMRNYPSAEEAGVVASSAPAGPGPNQPRSGGSQR